MSDEGAKNVALMIFIGLVMNGCMIGLSRTSIHESSIVDEREISIGMVEAACYLSGREWKFGTCEVSND